MKLGAERAFLLLWSQALEGHLESESIPHGATGGAHTGLSLEPASTWPCNFQRYFGEGARGRRSKSGDLSSQKL